MKCKCVLCGNGKINEWNGWNKNNGNRLQTVGLLFVESKKQTNKTGSDSPLPLPPYTHTHTNSTFDIFENVTVTFQWRSLSICMLRAERLGTAFYGVFSGLLGEFTPLTYPRRLEHETRDALAVWSARNNRVQGLTRQGTVNTVIFHRKELNLSVFTHFFFPGPILSWWHYTFAPLWLVHHIPIQTV